MLTPPIASKSTADLYHLKDYAAKKKLPLNMQQYLNMIKTTIARLLVCCFSTEQEAKTYVKNLCNYGALPDPNAAFRAELAQEYKDTISANAQLIKRWKTVDTEFDFAIQNAFLAQNTYLL